MKATRAGIVVEGVVYPETDGEPMASNTQQAEVMNTLYDNLCAMFADRDDVFVAMDLFWYPVKGEPSVRVAPDVMVVFGRPKGHRGAYLQFMEDNIAPQVVFEVVSPGNTPMEWGYKFNFYNQYGVQEYYIYDPETGEWEGSIRRDDHLEPIENMEGWVSPLLGIRFARGEGSTVKLYRPDGTLFISYIDLEQMARKEQRLRATAERRVEQLMQQLRALGIEPESEDADGTNP
jgi:hypothetical protein